MTTPEGKIEKHLKKEVEKSGGKVRKLKWIGKRGAPDRLMWWPGQGRDAFLRAALVEIKALGKKPTRVQEEEHKALREDGWGVYVVDSIEEADKVIAHVRGEIRKVSVPLLPINTTDKPHYDVKTPAHILEQQDDEDRYEQDNSDLA